MSAKIQTQSPLPSGPISAWDQPVRHASRLCLIFAQQLLRAAPAGQYRWCDDPELTEVLITGESPINASVIHKRPAIVLVRGPIAWANLTMDDLRDLDLHTGKKTHTDLISGTFTMNCLSRNPEVADDLAFVIGSHFWLLKDILLSLGFHTIGKGIQIGSPSPPGALVNGDTEAALVDVPVTIPFTFQYTASLEVMRVIQFREVLIEMSIQMAAPVRRYDGAATAQGGIGSALLEMGDPVAGTQPRFPKQRYQKGPVANLANRGATAERDETRVGPGTADPPMTVEVQVEE